MSISVLVAEDHRVVRQGVKALLGQEPDLQVIGETGDGEEAIRLVGELSPQVLILDLSLKGMGGLEVLRHLRRKKVMIRVVVLSVHVDPVYVREALRMGAEAYVAKDSGAEELVTAIRAASQGERYLSPPLTEPVAVVSKTGERDSVDKLTVRERDVLQLTAKGYTGAAVAENLKISPRTVESHRANMMRKLGLRNQKELIRFAVERKLTR